MKGSDKKREGQNAHYKSKVGKVWQGVGNGKKKKRRRKKDKLMNKKE